MAVVVLMDVVVFVASEELLLSIIHLSLFLHFFKPIENTSSEMRIISFEGTASSKNYFIMNTFTYVHHN